VDAQFFEWVLSVLILIFISIPVLRWHAAVVLFRARGYAIGHGLNKGAITERLIVAFSGAIGSTLLGIVGLNRVLGFLFWPVTSPVGFLLLLLALILFAVPAVIWEYMYLTGRLER